MRKSNKLNLNDREVRRMVEQMKGELAQEFGMQVPADGYWGNHSSKDLGKIGSHLQKRLPLLLEWKKKQAAKDGKKGPNQPTH